VAQVVKRHFRPEFLNRLDDVVVFEPLGADHLRKIARLQARPRGSWGRPAPVFQNPRSHFLDMPIPAAARTFYVLKFLWTDC